MKPTPINAFICGILFSTGWRMFVQDLMLALWQFARIQNSYDKERKRRNRRA